MVATLGVALITAGASRHSAVVAAVLPTSDELVRLAGFGIDQVSLTGQRMTFDGDVFDALDLANARSLASFDADAAKRRIERLPWVETVDLRHVYPDSLDVRITERKPFAVWRRGDRSYLIDATGRVLSAIGATVRSDLPRVAGEGAAEPARDFLALVGRYPTIAARLTEAERVGERRWTLHLDHDVTIHLPPDREASLIGMIASEGEIARLVAEGNCVIDMRVPDRMTVRAADGATPAGAAAGPS